jgi:hypothetical protein
MSQKERSILWEVTVSVALSKESVYVHVSYSSFPDRAISLYRNVNMHSNEQHAMSSHELQSALMLTVEFFDKVLY